MSTWSCVVFRRQMISSDILSPPRFKPPSATAGYTSPFCIRAQKKKDWWLLVFCFIMDKDHFVHWMNHLLRLWRRGVFRREAVKVYSYQSDPKQCVIFSRLMLKLDEDKEKCWLLNLSAALFWPPLKVWTQVRERAFYTTGEIRGVNSFSRTALTLCCNWESIHSLHIL